MKTKSAIVAALFLSFLSCGGQKKENENKETVTNNVKDKIELPYHINLPNKGQGELKVSFFADNVVYVLLETTKNSLLRRVLQVQMNDSMIGVADIRKLLLFRSDGTFVRQISQKGNGPQEYQAICDFHFKSDTIYILAPGKVLKYTLDGKFQWHKKIETLDNTTMDGSGSLIYYNENNGEITYFNATLKPTSKFEAVKNVTHGYWVLYDPADNYFHPRKGKMLFSSYKSDTIWNLAGKKMEAEYILNLKDKLLPPKLQLGNFKGSFADFQKAAQPYLKMNLIEQSNYLFLIQKSWGTGEKSAIYHHNFTDHTTRKFDLTNLEDDIVGKIKMGTNLELSTENDVITFVRADELVDALDGLNKQKAINEPKHNTWKTKMSKVKFDDNPILVMIKPRK